MDIERIKDKLSELQVYIAELSEDMPDEEEEYLGERLTRRACERTFQLADNKIIPKKLGARLEDMVSFRNLLIHRYGKVDDSRAYHFLKEEADDLYEFAESIEMLISKEE